MVSRLKQFSVEEAPSIGTNSLQVEFTEVVLPRYGYKLPRLVENTVQKVDRK